MQCPLLHSDLQLMPWQMQHFEDLIAHPEHGINM
jgi:hypothetical protein